MKPIVGSKWKHFKGKHYTVLGVGRHTETQEILVTYINTHDAQGTLLEDQHIWVRPLSMWYERVPLELHSRTELRFKEIK